MALKDSYKLFFAIPFDSVTRSIFDTHVIPSLKKKYPYKLVCVVGNKQIGSSAEYDSIETFKMQNSMLFAHFIAQIRDADVIIADLTDNNPNVHVELGIALSYNKNILRVTRQSYDRLAFDVRDYEVERYNKGGDLLDKIENYLDMFFKIKDLDFESANSSLYYHLKEKRVLSCWNNDEEKQRIRGAALHLENTNFKMRDGKTSVTFNLMDQVDDSDWFGIYFRVSDMGFLSGSILVYVRKSGEIEIATYPGQAIVGKAKLSSPLTDYKTLTVELEGSSIKATVDNVDLEFKSLEIQSSGFVVFGTHRTKTEYWDEQIVCRDTIATFDEFSL